MEFLRLLEVVDWATEAEDCATEVVRDPTGTELATEATDLLIEVVLEATGATEAESEETEALD